MTSRQPGDLILDTYLRSASIEEREAARENLHRLARLLIRIHERTWIRNPQPPTRENALGALDSESLPTIL